MKKIYILLFALAAAVGMTGCTSEMPEKTADEGGDILIRLQVDALETKSDPTGDENYVESLQLLIFKDINADPVACLTPSITPGGGPFDQSYTNAAALAGGLTGADLKTATVFAVANCSTNLSTVTSLANAKDVAVDAAAMVTDTPEGYKVKASPRFVMTAEGGFVVGSGADAGKAVASLLLKRLASKVSLTITYDQDLSDKDHPTLITTANADGTTTVWTPMTEGNVRVYLQNAVSNATLGGFDTPQTRFTYADVHPAGEPLKASAFYTYPPKWAAGSDDAPFIKIIQPWSYKTMKNGAAPGDPVKPVVVDESTVELYYKVMFPGMTELAGNTDYQFTVQLTVLGGESTRDMKEITPTGFSILPWGTTAAGSDLSPVVSNPAKYLAVERDTTIANNGAGVSIRYVASGPATLTVNSIKKWVYSNYGQVEKSMKSPASDGVSDVYSGSPLDAGSEDEWFKNTYPADPKKPNEGIITLKHKLSDNIFDPYITNVAARPYEYDLTLHLDGESTDLDQSFHITQNPPILVGGQHSNACVYVNDHIQNGENNNGNQGSAVNVYTAPSKRPFEGSPTLFNASKNIRIYGFTNSSTGNHGTLNYSSYYSALSTTTAKREAMRCYLGSVSSFIDLEEGDVKSNICQLRIIVRAAPSTANYILSPLISTTEDSSTPDFQYLDNLINNSYDTSNGTRNVSPFATSTSTTDATHTAVSAYRPGIRIEKGRDYVAPEFMVASSWGRSWAVYFEQAVLRCASYQEDGYPAGRWRLPTEAELHYLMALRDRNAIPDLVSNKSFASSGRMWTASGFLKPDDPSIASYGEMGFARCVYDTWYWGRGEDKILYESRGVARTINEVSGRYLYPWSGFVTSKRPTVSPSDKDF